MEEKLSPTTLKKSVTCRTARSRWRKPRESDQGPWFFKSLHLQLACAYRRWLAWIENRSQIGRPKKLDGSQLPGFTVRCGKDPFK